MKTLSIPDMSCGHCKASVEAALAPLAQDIAVDLQTRQVRLATTAPDAAVLAALSEIGFPAQVLA